MPVFEKEHNLYSALVHLKKKLFPLSYQISDGEIF